MTGVVATGVASAVGRGSGDCAQATELMVPASAIRSNAAGKRENSRRMMDDPPAGERCASERHRLHAEGQRFNEVDRSFCRSSRWNPAIVVNPENLTRWCDHRFLAPRSVVAVRWSHSVPKRARHSRPRPLQNLSRFRRSGTRMVLDPCPHSRQSYHTRAGKLALGADLFPNKGRRR